MGRRRQTPQRRGKTLPQANEGAKLEQWTSVLVHAATTRRVAYSSHRVRVAVFSPCLRPTVRWEGEVASTNARTRPPHGMAYASRKRLQHPFTACGARVQQALHAPSPQGRLRLEARQSSSGASHVPQKIMQKRCVVMQASRVGSEAGMVRACNWVADILNLLQMEQSAGKCLAC